MCINSRRSQRLPIDVLLVGHWHREIMPAPLWRLPGNVLTHPPRWDELARGAGRSSTTRVSAATASCDRDCCHSWWPGDFDFRRR